MCAAKCQRIHHKFMSSILGGNGLIIQSSITGYLFCKRFRMRHIYNMIIRLIIIIIIAYIRWKHNKKSFKCYTNAHEYLVQSSKLGILFFLLSLQIQNSFYIVKMIKISSNRLSCVNDIASTQWDSTVLLIFFEK